MSEPLILRNEWDGVLELVLNRPEKLNALTCAMFDTIREAVEDLRDREDLKVMLIRAKGRYFSAGADLVEDSDNDRGFEKGKSPALARRWFRVDMKHGMHAIYEEMERVEKPIVVAHHATCLGGGLELSLSCDFRLAAKSASYGFPEIEFGMLPLSGGVSRLTRICGEHWARWMIIANKHISAERALIAGLVHEVYPDETFEDEVRAFCRDLAGHAPEAMAAGKLALELCRELSTADARQVERLTYSSITFSKEHEILSAKRRARLSGEHKK